MIEYLRNHLWAAIAVSVLSLGVLGAGLKYLEQDAAEQNVLKAKDRSALSAINPFVTSPSQTPTPQLAKEYVYAGSRLLAVEDAGANAAPPADLAVWRPSTGVWWVLGGPGSQQVSAGWGTTGDVPVPGDYDGDGKTDFAIFRPSTGAWWIVRSSDSTTFNLTFGQTGDLPVAADFDGDGKSDQAVFRQNTPTTGDATWYVNQSSGAGVITQQFGLSSDKPAPADYDGDGRADVTVWRSSNNTFYSLQSTTGELDTATFASTSIDPVSGDYDGDGKADYAIRNAANWIIRKSSNLQTDTISWHESGDTAVHNDYDGDGIVDIAVWRASNGTWYIRQSSKLGISGQTPTEQIPYPNELRETQWGTDGDKPVPAYFRREPF